MLDSIEKQQLEKLIFLSFFDVNYHFKQTKNAIEEFVDMHKNKKIPIHNLHKEMQGQLNRMIKNDYLIKTKEDRTCYYQITEKGKYILKSYILFYGRIVNKFLWKNLNFLEDLVKNKRNYFINY